MNGKDMTNPRQYCTGVTNFRELFSITMTNLQCFCQHCTEKILFTLIIPNMNNIFFPDTHGYDQAVWFQDIGTLHYFEHAFSINWLIQRKKYSEVKGFFHWNIYRKKDWKND